MPELIEDSELDELSFSPVVPVVNKSRHYVDDDNLTAILSVWKVEFDKNKAEGIERPPLPEAVGEAIVDMAESMGKRHNFSGYSYLDEMKSEAHIHCVKYIHNFNPTKKSEKKGKVSAFGYINMIIWRSFTHYIQLEKKQQYLKYKSFELMGGIDAFKDEDMNAASGGEEGDSGNSIGALGTDFIQKAREYEEANGLDGKGGKKVPTDKFDNFMFALDMPNESEMDLEFEDIE